MTALEAIAERRIVDAQREGAFDGLAGRGRRLDLEDDSAVPSEWRAAFRVLKNAGFAPEWIVMGKEIDETRRRLEEALAEGRQAEEGLRAEVAALNRRIGNFNLRVPHACLQKRSFRI